MGQPGRRGIRPAARCLKDAVADVEGEVRRRRILAGPAPQGGSDVADGHRSEDDLVRAAHAGDRSDEVLSRRSRSAGLGIVLVLLAVSVFGVWSSQETSSAADQVSVSIRIASHYSDAARAAQLEEPIELEYRLHPDPAGRARQRTTTDQLVEALSRIRHDGDGDDRQLADEIQARLGDYLISAGRLFAAVDRGDLVAAAHLDATGTDVALEQIQTLVITATAQKHQIALAELEDLHDLESLNRVLTPLVFLTGLLISALLALITRGHRRVLDAERAQALHDSQHDPLTGLPNRALLTERLTRSLRGDPKRLPHTVLLIVNLNRFKSINDTFGYQHGDELIAQVATRLKDRVGASGSVAHLGADEFAILLPAAPDLVEALAIVADFQESLQVPFLVEGIELEIEASTGIASSPEHGHDAATLLRHADVAMHVAKSTGLGSMLYDPVADEHTPAKVTLLSDLRRGIDREELFLQYQPKVDLQTGGIAGVEALVRWDHPERGLLPPDSFIPLAENSGLIGPLTDFVLCAALAQGRAWIQAGRPTTVAVNLSARNLLDETMPSRISDLLEQSGLPAELLVLEVTESAIMLDPAKGQRLLNQLAALGVRIAIDDFGTGYTSLGQLQYLPVHELKIDRSFVKTLEHDPRSAHIVRNIINLGHDLGLVIVAEGIEDQRTMDLLTRFGCDIGQGYYLSLPVAPEAFDEWRGHRPELHLPPPAPRAPPMIPTPRA
jgi:diguanylate cyclase (GGDEF)-like protein